MAEQATEQVPATPEPAQSQQESSDTKDIEIPADMLALAGYNADDEKPKDDGEDDDKATEGDEGEAEPEAEEKPKAEEPKTEKPAEPKPDEPKAPTDDDKAQAAAQEARRKELDDLERDSQALADKLGKEGGFDPFNEADATLAIKTLAKQNEILRQAIAEDRRRRGEMEAKATARERWEQWGQDNPHIGMKKGQEIMAEEISRAEARHGKGDIATAVAMDRWQDRVAAIAKEPAAKEPPPAPAKKPREAVVPTGGKPSGKPVENVEGLTVTQKRERGFYRF